MKSRLFRALTLCAVLLALLLPDLVDLLQVPGGWVVNAALALSMLMFLAELLGNSASKRTYLGSAALFIDAGSLLSLILDISSVEGALRTRLPAEQPHGGAGVSPEARAMLRLVRVLKLVTYVHNVEGLRQAKMSEMVRKKLIQGLVTRAGCAVFLVALAFSIVHFLSSAPDESPLVWLLLLSSEISEFEEATHIVPADSDRLAAATRKLHQTMGRLSRFYGPGQQSISPFAVCYGTLVGESFTCQDDVLRLQLQSGRPAPERLSSVWELQAQNVQLLFDMSTIRRLEALRNLLVAATLALAVCAWNFNLSFPLALEPIEKLLASVRGRCVQILNHLKELEELENCAGQGSPSLEESECSEFVLLEEAIVKLESVTLPPLQKEIREEPTEYDRIWASFTQGQRQQQEDAAARQARDECVSVLKRRSCSRSLDLKAQSVIIKELQKMDPDLGRALKSDDFNALDLTSHQKVFLAAHVLFNQEASCDYVQALVPEKVLLAFVEAVEKDYPPNPFHNFAHGLDVLYTVARHLRTAEAHRFLSEPTLFWIMVAAIGHDLGHGGVNNAFLIETMDPLALTYNDLSPLENLHCARLFKILSLQQANLFSEMDKETFRETRRGIINAILHTDFAKHNEMVKELNLLFEMNSEVFALGDDPEVDELLQKHEGSMANALLHLADIGNPLKPWNLATRFAALCLEEFFAQGDKEKELGIPVQALNDREKVNRPNSQLGFIEFLLLPFLEGVVRICPQLDSLAVQCGDNMQNWERLWISEAERTREQEEKLRLRVDKVVARCQTLLQGVGQLAPLQ